MQKLGYHDSVLSKIQPTTICSRQFTTSTVRSSSGLLRSNARNAKVRATTNLTKTARTPTVRTRHRSRLSVQASTNETPFSTVISSLDCLKHESFLSKFFFCRANICTLKTIYVFNSWLGLFSIIKHEGITLKLFNFWFCSCCCFFSQFRVSFAFYVENSQLI